MFLNGGCILFSVHPLLPSEFWKKLHTWTGATQILMLIAGEVGTKSKWAIPPELYFQMAHATRRPSTFCFLPFNFLEGEK